MMNTPVRHIDEILAALHSADDFRDIDLPPSDDDAWMYNGEDELNSALLERQKEMEVYESKHKKSQKLKEQNDTDQSSGAALNDFDPGDIAKTMQAFVCKISSYEGAEVPENRDSKAVDLDVDSFMKYMESIMGQGGHEGTSMILAQKKINPQIPILVTNTATENMDEDFTLVNVDVNLVKSLLDSFSSQQGLPGPASNLLGLMGLQLPRDSSKEN